MTKSLSKIMTSFSLRSCMKKVHYDQQLPHLLISRSRASSYSWGALHGTYPVCPSMLMGRATAQLYLTTSLA